MTDWLIYGAYGFTGELVARRAVAAGERPVLSGRDETKVRRLADELGLEWRSAALDDPASLDAALEDVRSVAHCAGPFSATATQMVDACLRTHTNYVDINGEIDVLEAVHARDEHARAAGVTLISGAGFDVVPSDCLIAMTAAELPGATRIELAFRAGGGVSRGTMRSAAGMLGSMSLGRTDGVIQDVPPSERTRTVEFDGKDVRLAAVSWGDVSTAFHSTGIPTVRVYTELPGPAVRVARLAGAPVFRSLVPWAMRRAASVLPNPTAATMTSTGTRLWAQATDPDGRTATKRMTTPNTYALTADSVVQVIQRIAMGDVDAGAHTPSRALGADFALGLDGVVLD